MTAVYGLVKQGSGTRHQEITGNVVFATVLPVLLQKYTAAAELLPSQRPLRVGLANGSIAWPTRRNICCSKKLLPYVYNPRSVVKNLRRLVTLYYAIPDHGSRARDRGEAVRVFLEQFLTVPRKSPGFNQLVTTVLEHTQPTLKTKRILKNG